MDPKLVPLNARSQSMLLKRNQHKNKQKKTTITTSSTLSRRARKGRLLKDNILGVTRPAIRRLARRGGVVRMKAEIYDEVRKALKSRLEDIIRRAILVAETGNCNRRKTVTTSDIVYALQMLGTPMYGFGDRRDVE